MADGGIVAFANGGLGGEFGGTDFDTRMPEETETVTVPTFEIDPMTGKKLFSGYRNPIEVKKEPRREPFGVAKPKPDTSPLPAMGPTDDELNRFAPAPTPQDQIEKLVGGTQGGEKEKSMMDRYLSLLEGREKSSADQRKQDAYLSLLSAGLGMMGGTSPYAAVNIGQGAQAGVAAQAAARKTQAAEEAATLKGFGTAAVAEEYAKQRQLVAAQAQEAKIPQQLANIKQNVMKNIVAAKKIDINSLDQNQLAEIERQTEAAIAKDPGYQSLYSRLYGGKFAPAVVAAPAVDYGKAYGLTPKPTK
jgi:hypothetical protein